MHAVPIRPRDHDAQTLDRWTERRRQVGARIREVRLERGLTQESLALECGVSRNQLIAVEWGKSSLAIERLFDLAEALDIAPGELLEAPHIPPTRKPYRGGRRSQSAS